MDEWTHRLSIAADLREYIEQSLIDIRQMMGQLADNWLSKHPQHTTATYVRMTLNLERTREFLCGQLRLAKASEKLLEALADGHAFVACSEPCMQDAAESLAHTSIVLEAVRGGMFCCACCGRHAADDNILLRAMLAI